VFLFFIIIIIIIKEQLELLIGYFGYFCSHTHSGFGRFLVHVLCSFALSVATSMGFATLDLLLIGFQFLWCFMLWHSSFQASFLLALNGSLVSDLVYYVKVTDGTVIEWRVWQRKSILVRRFGATTT
jgi:hypothetical protein